MLSMYFVCTDNIVERATAGSVRRVSHGVWVVVWFTCLSWWTL